MTMENLISGIVTQLYSLTSKMCFLLCECFTEFRCVVYDTLTHDFNITSEHLTPLYAAIGSCIVPILFCNIVYSLCCSKNRQSFYEQGGKIPVPVNAYFYEALRWYRQSQYDLQAAKYDLEQDEPASEWSCFKCQQAAEKAVKAVLISLGLSHSTGQGSHNLYDLASTSQDKQLIRLASSLQGGFGHVGRMRYPDQIPYPKVPRDVYSRTIAGSSIEITETLLNHVKDNYMKPPHMRGDK